MLHLATIRATCVATKLRDKLQEKLPNVTAPLLIGCGLIYALTIVSFETSDSTTISDNN